MALDYRLAALPPVWPGKATPPNKRKRSQFDSTWTATLDLLERELYQLRARDVVLAVNVTPFNILQDGKLRGGTRIDRPEVILSFMVGKDRLSFPCDTFTSYEDNVRAIALSLEALRKVDRYGVQQGRQYEGFKALPGGGSTAATMTVEAAALAVASWGPHMMARIVDDATEARAAVRLARAKSHPDAGGSAEKFALIETAKRVLEAHHGGSL